MSTIFEGSLENWGGGGKTTKDTLVPMMMAIAEHFAAADREGNEKAKDATVCSVMSAALFGDRAMTKEEIAFTASVWDATKDFCKEGSWRNGAD